MTALKDALDALRPFAVLADKWKQAQDGKLNLPDDWLVAIAPSDALTIGDLRRAAAAVEAIDKMQEAPPPPVGDMVLVPREVMEAKRTRYSDRLSPRILESVGKDIEEWRDLALEAVNDIHALLATAAPLPAQEVSEAIVERGARALFDSQTICIWNVAKDAARVCLQSALRPGKD